MRRGVLRTLLRGPVFGLSLARGRVLPAIPGEGWTYLHIEGDDTHPECVLAPVALCIGDMTAGSMN